MLAQDEDRSLPARRKPARTHQVTGDVGRPSFEGVERTGVEPDRGVIRLLEGTVRPPRQGGAASLAPARGLTMVDLVPGALVPEHPAVGVPDAVRRSDLAVLPRIAQRHERTRAPEWPGRCVGDGVVHPGEALATDCPVRQEEASVDLTDGRPVD